VQVGDVVAIDQPVVEVETAKATVEVPSPFAGTVERLHGEEGGVVDVGAPLISIGTGASAEAGSGAVLVGYGTTEAPRRSRRGRRIAALADSRTSPARKAAPAVVSPVVRRLAREYGLDLGTLRGSGRGGLIVRADVVRAHTEQAAPETVGERIPLRGVRGLVAEKLARSRREIPDATTWVDVDATELVAARAALNDGDPAVRISLLALFARFCLAGLRRFPELNATVDVERAEIVRLPYVNLGFAAQTDRGLVVPVIKDAHRRTTAELASEIARLTAAARAGTLAPAELTGGTFTLNNYGVFGVDGSDAIINHPEAGILGVGRLLPRPWVVDGELAVRMITQLSLSFDHRVCDGGAAGGFLRYVADLVERPNRLFRDI
jgi:pyruvate dehydrogenase E2 component (dihydrolipoamide acetyltransferase)